MPDNARYLLPGSTLCSTYPDHEIRSPRPGDVVSVVYDRYTKGDKKSFLGPGSCHARVDSLGSWTFFNPVNLQGVEMTRSRVRTWAKCDAGQMCHGVSQCVQEWNSASIGKATIRMSKFAPGAVSRDWQRHRSGLQMDPSPTPQGKAANYEIAAQMHDRLAKTARLKRPPIGSLARDLFRDIQHAHEKAAKAYRALAELTPEEINPKGTSGLE